MAVAAQQQLDEDLERRKKRVECESPTTEPGKLDTDLSQKADSAQQDATTPVEKDSRIQPWQSLMVEIERQNTLSPPGSDYFPCQDGFFAHSLAG